jgi:TonB family protein
MFQAALVTDQNSLAMLFCWVMPRSFFSAFAALTLCCSTALGQSASQLVSSLEKHTVVLRNYYTDTSLTFDGDGKLISGGTPGFGPTDGRFYVEHAEITDDRLVLVGERPALFWDLAAREFRLTDIGRRSEVFINLPSGKAIEEVVPPLLTQVFLKQSELQQIKCSDSDRKVEGSVAVTKRKASKRTVTNLPDAQSLSEVQMLCFPAGERAYLVFRGVRAPKAISAPDPHYPEAARKEKRQGTVVLALIVDESGRPSTIIVTRPLGYGFDEKALDSVRTWTFKPATFQNQPVSVGINVEVNFRLY